MKRILSVLCISIFLLLASGSEYAEAFFTYILTCENLEESTDCISTKFYITVQDESGNVLSEDIDFVYYLYHNRVEETTKDDYTYCIPKQDLIGLGDIYFDSDEEIINVPNTCFSYESESLLLKIKYIESYYKVYEMQPYLAVLHASSVDVTNPFNAVNINL